MVTRISKIMERIFRHHSVRVFLMLGLLLLFAGAQGLCAKEKVLRLCDSESDKDYTMDPDMLAGEKNHNQLNNVFEGLLAFDHEDNHIIPALATEWKRLDPVTIQFKLRQGVKFHNGEEFDAHAVKFSLERTMVNSAGKLLHATVWSVLDRVDIVDRYTVNVVTRHPDALILRRLATFGSIVSPQHAREAGMEGMAEYPVGTGPFKFKEWIKGEKIILTANKEYWEPGFPKIDRAEFYFYDVKKRLKEFIAGRLDMISNTRPTIVLRAAAKNQENRVIKRDTFSSAFCILNTLKDGPLKNKLVRKALNHAVDVSRIIKYGAKGNGTPIATTAMKGEVGFNPDLKPYPYDPEKAKQLLAEAGYPKGFKLTAAVTPQAGGTEGPLAKIVKSQLKAVGVQIEMRTITAIGEIAIQKKNRQIPQADMNMGVLPEPYGHIAFHQGLFFHSKGMVSMVDDPQYDRLFEQAIQTIDPSEHVKLCHNMEEYLKKQAYYINMYQTKKIYNVKRKVHFRPGLNGVLCLHELEMY